MLNTVSNSYTVFIIPHAVINEIYGLGKALCVLLIAITVFTAVLELKKTWSKLLLTALSALALTLHYAVVATLSTYIKVRLAPFVIIELNERFGTETVSIDYGQVLAMLTVLVWRRELVAKIKPLIRRVGERLATTRGKRESNRGEKPNEAA